MDMRDETMTSLFVAAGAGLLAIALLVGSDAQPERPTAHTPTLRAEPSDSVPTVAVRTPVVEPGAGAEQGLTQGGQEHPLVSPAPPIPLTRPVTADTLAEWMTACGKDPGVARELWPVNEKLRAAWSVVQRKCELKDAISFYFVVAQTDYLRYEDPTRIRAAMEPVIAEMREWGVAEAELEDALDLYEAGVISELWLNGDEATLANEMWALTKLLNDTPRLVEAANLIDTLIPDVEQ